MLEDIPVDPPYLVESSNSLAALYGKYAKCPRARILGNNIVVIAAWVVRCALVLREGYNRSDRGVEMMGVHVESSGR